MNGRLQKNHLLPRKRPMEFIAFRFTTACNAAKRTVYLGLCCLFEEGWKPLAFAPGPKELPFPTRKETIPPANEAERFANAVREDGGAVVFSYRGRDCDLRYRVPPKTGTLNDLALQYRDKMIRCDAALIRYNKPWKNAGRTMLLEVRFMNTPSTRRDFLRQSAAAAGAATVAAWRGPLTWAEGKPVKSPNERLNIANIGVGGRGGAHIGPALNENLVAICDVSENKLQACLKRVDAYYREHDLKRPLPKTYVDYREMLNEIHPEIDAVVVATPDNHHALATMKAIKLGKHVYCEKPLTHDLYEARRLTLAARLHKVATQLGNQGRAGEGWRLLCEYLWAGIIGNVREVHTWTDRPGIPSRFWWPQGGTRPPGEDPIPKDLHWDLWLGPAPKRPYLDTYKEGKFKGKRVYQPFVWRGWWDFGTGALGDIACHAWSGPFTALKIEHAVAVTLLEDTGDTTGEMYPSASKIMWDIPARGDLPPCRLFWYDGGKYPSREVSEFPEEKAYPTNGTILVGEKGKLWWGGGRPELIPAGKMKEFKAPPKSIPRCASDHFREWVTAAKGGRPAFSNFDHAGPLTELVLLGNLAIRAGVGQRVEWDGPNLRVTNLTELNRYVQREYREGWSL